MSEHQEIMNEILNSKDNLAAAIAISRTMGAVKHKLLENLKKDLNEKFNEDGRFKLIWPDEKDYSYTYFGFSISGYDNQEILLRFEFQSRNLQNLCWGLCRNDESINDPDRWDKINNLMSNEYEYQRSTAWWPWSIYADDKWFSSTKNYRYWDNDSNAWESILNGDIVQEIFSLVNRTYELFEEKNAIDLLIK